MMKTKLILMLFMLTSLQFFAQEKTVSGTVTTADDGMPLPGVNVVIKGTSTGTTTDFDGNYKLDVTPDDMLVFSYIGFKEQTITVGNQNTVDVVMQSDAAALSEVVVIGYGAAEKQDLTGAISSVTSEDITKQPSLTATQAIQGKVAGVNITNSDAPGATPTVTIRGLGTALGGRDPLYVVDGTPVGDIKNISPSSIKSIDFLKDASSASIYGVRAANGVVIITTKNGKEGKPKFQFKSYYGVKDILNQVELANASQYITYFNEANSILGKETLKTNQRYDTDWYDELTRLGTVQNDVFSVSGGADNIDYYFSMDYYEEKGLLEGQKYQRTTLTNNNTYHLFDDRLKIKQNVNVSFRHDVPKPFSSFNDAYRLPPVIPVFYDNGRYGQTFYNKTTGEATYKAGPGESVGKLTSHGNPVAAVDYANQLNNATILQGNISAELKLLDGLTFTSRFGGRKSFFKSRSFSDNKFHWLNADPTRTEQQFENNKADKPESLNWVNNSFSFSTSEIFKYSWDNFLTYKQSFGDHNLELTAGGSKESIGVGNSISGQAYDIPSQKQYWSLDKASDQYDKTVNQSYYTPTHYMSYFGRVQYNFNRKYYATATVRRDGSSVFKSNGEYWGTFPSAGLGWTISKESFLDKAEFLDFLKLRASYGKLGNAQIPLNVTQIFTSTGAGNQNYVLGPNQDLVFGASVGSPAIDLTWEKVSEWDGGIDFKLFDSKLSGNFDYYYKKTENAIFSVQPLLNSTYANSFYDYGGEVINKGYEVALSWKDKINDDFSYNISGTFSHNNNNVTDVRKHYDGQIGGDLRNGNIAKRLANNQPLGSWWMYEAIGVWQNQDEIDDNASLGSAKPGFLRYNDVNDDGVIDQRDKKYFGSYVPTFNYGISLSANYKQFDLSIDGYGAGGNKVYNGLSNTRLGGENIPVDVFKNRWTGEGSTNTNPGALRDYEASSYYLEDGDYFRINNITVGYTIPENSDFIAKARIYLSAQNPFLFTGYSGFTPELNHNITTDPTKEGDPYGTTGIELSAYPNTRTFLIGLNLEL